MPHDSTSHFLDSRSIGWLVSLLSPYYICKFRTYLVLLLQSKSTTVFVHHKQVFKTLFQCDLHAPAHPSDTKLLPCVSFPLPSPCASFPPPRFDFVLFFSTPLWHLHAGCPLIPLNSVSLRHF